MYIKVTLSLLTIVGLVIAIELAAMGQLASRQREARAAREAASAGTIVSLDQSATPKDIILDGTVDRMEIPLMPLCQALDQFEVQSKVTVRVSPSLSDSQLQALVEVHLHGIPVMDALDAIVAQVTPRPDHGVRGAALTVGDPGDMQIRCYNVRSIATWSLPADAELRGRDQSDEALSQLIQSTIAPSAWRERSDSFGNHGAGEIHVWGGVLVVNQTASHHREIAQFLSKLKDAKPRVGGIMGAGNGPGSEFGGQP